jgi:hypothetical protein
MRSSLCAVVSSRWLRRRLAGGTSEDDADAAAALSGPLSDPRSEAACPRSSQIIMCSYLQQYGRHSHSREAGRHRILASGYTSCMQHRYRLRCISSTSVSLLAVR